MYIYTDIHLHSKQTNKALKMQSLKDAASSVGDKVESMMAQEKPGAAAGGSYSFSATTGQEGQSTGSHQMSALPGHGKGEPAGHVVEGTATVHPIGKATGAPGRNTTAQNTHVGGAGGQTYGTGGGYNG